MRSIEYRMTSTCFHEHCLPKPVWALAAVAKLRASKQMDGICDIGIRTLAVHRRKISLCVGCPLKQLVKLISV